jgi:hypothetical protein
VGRYIRECFEFLRILNNSNILDYLARCFARCCVRIHELHVWRGSVFQKEKLASFEGEGFGQTFFENLSGDTSAPPLLKLLMQINVTKSI